MTTHHRHVFAALFTATLIHSSSDAQTAWTSLGPAPRIDRSPVAYDSVRDRVVGLVNVLGTWEYDGVSWTQASTSSGIVGCDAMAFDPVRQRTVLQSGWQTWEWDGVNWSLRSTSHMVTGFTFHAGRGRLMAFSDLDGRHVPTGGVIPSGNDLREWDGSNWNVVPTGNAPPWQGPLSNQYYLYGNLTYDPARDRLYLFGKKLYVPSSGIGLSYPYVAETWEWDASNGWVQRNVGGPGGNELATVFDEQRRRVVCLWQSGLTPAQVAEWDGAAQWSLLQGLTPPGGWLVTVPAYDSLRGRALLFDGLGGLSAYGPSNPASYQLHGPGCPGPLGVPTLSLVQPWTLPWLGDLLAVQVDGLPMGTAVLTTGLSDQVAGSVALPLDLTPYGLPGCQLRMSPDVSVMLSGPGTSATLALPIPPALRQHLLGLPFFQQALVPTAVGGAISNSVRGVIGSR